MAIIPLKDTVTITKAGALDDWGQPTAGTSASYACRINESTKLTRNQQGAEVVSTTQILIGGAVAIGYDDTVSLTDASGVQRTDKPIRIAVIKDISSKPLFTEVEL